MKERREEEEGGLLLIGSGLSIPSSYCTFTFFQMIDNLHMEPGLPHIEGLIEVCVRVYVHLVMMSQLSRTTRSIP